MATLHITEFKAQDMKAGTAEMLAKQPYLANQTKTVGAEGDSAAFNAQTGLVRLCTDTACHVKFFRAGEAGNATTSDMYLPANVPEYFLVPTAGNLSVIAA